MKKSIVTVILLFSATSILPMRPPLLKTSSQLAQQLIRSGGQRKISEFAYIMPLVPFIFITTPTIFANAPLLYKNCKFNSKMKDHFNKDQIQQFKKIDSALSQPDINLAKSQIDIIGANFTALAGVYDIIHPVICTGIITALSIKAVNSTLKGFVSSKIAAQKLNELIANKESQK